MRRALSSLLCLLTALHLCGGHLGLAQMVAWAQMIRDYSAQKGLAQGLKETFDGDHPCRMCCKIAQAKQEEERRSAPLPQQKNDCLSKWLTSETEEVLPASVWADHPSGLPPVDGVRRASARAVKPPVPPPRTLV